MRRLSLLLPIVVATFALAGCGGSAAAPTSDEAPFYLSLSQSMTSAPVPASTTQILFSTNRQPTGTPHFSGSDGSSFDGTPLVIGSCLTAAGSFTTGCSGTSTVQALQPHTTYVVTFPQVQYSNETGGNVIVNETANNANAGSFQTQ